MLTQDRLKELLNYDPLTGIFSWRAQVGPRAYAGKRAGYLNSYGYRKIEIKGRAYAAHRLAWLYSYDDWPPTDVDHIDRDKDNNAVANLRLVTDSENVQNSNLRADNACGCKGVHWHKAAGKWVAYITLHGTQKHLGVHPTLFDAVCARKSAEIELHPYRAA